MRFSLPVQHWLKTGKGTPPWLMHHNLLIPADDFCLHFLMRNPQGDSQPARKILLKPSGLIGEPLVTGKRRMCYNRSPA
jgi:hypothetical protein